MSRAKERTRSMRTRLAELTHVDERKCLSGRCCLTFLLNLTQCVVSCDCGASLRSGEVVACGMSRLGTPGSVAGRATFSKSSSTPLMRATYSQHRNMPARRRIARRLEVHTIKGRDSWSAKSWTQDHSTVQCGPVTSRSKSKMPQAPRTYVRPPVRPSPAQRPGGHSRTHVA